MYFVLEASELTVEQVFFDFYTESTKPGLTPMLYSLPYCVLQELVVRLPAEPRLLHDFETNVLKMFIHHFDGPKCGGARSSKIPQQKIKCALSSIQQQQKQEIDGGGNIGIKILGVTTCVHCSNVSLHFEFISFPSF